MKKFFIFAFAALISFSFFSCGDDEVDPTPSENNGDKDGDKELDKEYQNTEKANEGKMAFAQGTSLYYEVAADGAAVRLWYNAAEDYNITYANMGEGVSWISNMGGDKGKAGEGNTVLYISQNETDKQRDAYVCFNMSGGYRKVIKVHQMGKGEVKKAQALPDYAKKNYWRRTDREKLGLYGPVKYYATHDEVFTGVEYHFDREGHLTSKTQNGNEEFKYDSQGRLVYYKWVDKEFNHIYTETFYEYNNPGKYVYTNYVPKDRCEQDEFIIPDLSHYRYVSHQNGIEARDYSYKFEGNTLNIISYREFINEDDPSDVVHFSDDTLSVNYNGSYMTGYDYPLPNGDKTGIGPVEYFSNGMFKSYLYTTAYDFSSNTQYIFVKECYETTFMDYAGQMLPKSYHDYNPNANSDFESITDYTYNEHMDLVKETVVHPNPGSSSYPDDEITFTQYAYDKYGNWVTRYVYSRHGAGNRERARYIEYYDEQSPTE